jgi:hypothetical protein
MSTAARRHPRHQNSERAGALLVDRDRDVVSRFLGVLVAPSDA